MSYGQTPAEWDDEEEDGNEGGEWDSYSSKSVVSSKASKTYNSKKTTAPSSRATGRTKVKNKMRGGMHSNNNDGGYDYMFDAYSMEGGDKNTANSSSSSSSRVEKKGKKGEKGKSHLQTPVRNNNNSNNSNPQRSPLQADLNNVDFSFLNTSSGDVTETPLKANVPVNVASMADVKMELKFDKGLKTGGGNNTAAATHTNTTTNAKEPVVTSVSFLFDPPVETCSLNPYVFLRETDGSSTVLRNNHENAPKGDEYSQGAGFKWLRGQRRMCSAQKCVNVAHVQCLPCVKARVPTHLSYFCSHTCMLACWKLHRGMHSNKREVIGNVRWTQDAHSAAEQKESDAATAVSCFYPAAPTNTWSFVTSKRSYTPGPADIGRNLQLEIAPLIKTQKGYKDSTPSDRKDELWDALKPNTRLGQRFSILTQPVEPVPAPPPPRKIVYQNVHPERVANSSFKVFNYNVLAEMYATRHMYPYTEIWALAWNFRKKNILRDILSHDANILCLQEVQANHFESFFLPELAKHGYEGVYKRKTREAMGENQSVIDGCAIFFKRTRFMLSERYGVEFNEAARQHFGTDKRKLRRLMKGNIGLVVVLEDIGSNRRVKRKLCVCNTHTYWDPEFADVKLWQTWILCKELEEFVCNRGLPLLLCGDFNSMKDSAVYELLSTERLHPNSPIFQKDTASILPQDYNEISHRLDLQSTYSCIGEPAYTNYTKQFKGVLDYIFFTKNNLVCTAVVDVDDEKLLKEHTALPSPHYPSDHISLVATLDWLVDPPNIRQSSGGYQPNKSRGYPRR